MKNVKPENQASGADGILSVTRDVWPSHAGARDQSALCRGGDARVLHASGASSTSRGKLRVSDLVFAAVTSLAAVAASPLRADDLVVLSAAAVKTAVAGVPAILESASGDHVRFVFGTAGAMRDEALGGTAFDLVILPPATLADLAKQNFAVAASEKPLGTVRLGAASAADAVVPQVSSLDALTEALRSAPSIGIADPARGATSGKFLDKLFTTLGVAEVVRPKLKLFAEGQLAMEAVARHEVALGLGQISEAAPVPGLLLAPLPDAAQLKTTYSGALAAHSTHPEAARRLLDTLSSGPVQAAFKANGFDIPR